MTKLLRIPALIASVTLLLLLGLSAIGSLYLGFGMLVEKIIDSVLK